MQYDNVSESVLWCCHVICLKIPEQIWKPSLLATSQNRWLPNNTALTWDFAKVQITKTKAVFILPVTKLCTTDSIFQAVMNAHGNRLLLHISWCSGYTRSINTHLPYSFSFYDTKRGNVDDVYHKPSIMLAAHVYQSGQGDSTVTRKIIWVYEMHTIKTVLSYWYLNSICRSVNITPKLSLYI